MLGMSTNIPNIPSIFSELVLWWVIADTLFSGYNNNDIKEIASQEWTRSGHLATEQGTPKTAYPVKDAFIFNFLIPTAEKLPRWLIMES